MSEATTTRKYTDKEYEEFEYFCDDDLIVSQGQKIVKTRTPHKCVTMFPIHEIAVGSKAVRESAIDPDMGRVSNYICLDCADKLLDKFHDED